MRITTLRTTSPTCPDIPSCPSVHDVDIDPEYRYVISKKVSHAERAVFATAVTPGEILGWMPYGFLPAGNRMLDRTRDVTEPALQLRRQYVITTEVTDPEVLAAFAELMAPDEQLGTVPVPALVEV